MSGYEQESRSDGPPRNVLSNETIRQALARANSAHSNSTQSSRGGPGQGIGSRSNSSHSMSSQSRPDPLRRSSTASSGRKKSSHGNCDCIDCRDTSARDSYGATRTDKNGDKVREWDGDEAPPMHCHVQPGLFDEEETSNHSPGSRNSGRPPSGGRTNTGGSPGRKNSESRTYTRTEGGDLVEEWAGSEAPAIRTHYDWDAAENQGHSGGRRSPKERKSSRAGGY